MWIPADRPRLLNRAGGGLSVAVFSCLLLCACAPRTAARQVLATQCMPVGVQHEQVLSVVAPANGALRIGIDERGISLVASLDAGHESVSPTERLGAIALVANTRAGESHSVRIRAEDSPDITGTVCVSAQLISDSDVVRVTAERAFAAAGRATRDQDWNTAFEQYLRSSRAFDRLGLHVASAQARQAMAEIAYLRLDRKRDSFALAGEALARYGKHADAARVGALTGLQGKALLDIPGMDPREAAPRVRQLLAIARRYDTASAYSAREVPRLDIMSGFLEFMLDSPTRAGEVFATASQGCRELRDWDCYAIANQNLAELAAESNNYAAALSAFADALRVLPPDLDPKLSADIWNNYGRVQGTVGLFSRSEHSHETAMRFYARLGDCPGVRRSLSWSGILMVEVGSLGDAEDYLQQAASGDCADLLAAGVRSSAGSDSAGSDSAGPRMQHGQAGARTDFCAHPLDAGTLAIENKVIVFNSLLSLANALTLEGKSTLARRCIDAAGHYAATARTQMRLAIARGDTLLDDRDAAGARAAFAKSLRIADEAMIPARFEHRGAAQLGILRSELLEGNPVEAQRGGLEALTASVGRGNIDQTITSLRLLGSAMRDSGSTDRATRTLLTAADLIEAVPIDELDGEKRATFLATQHTVFADLTELYASQAADDREKAWLAFETSERGRARSLRFAITQQTQDASSAPEAQPEARYQKLLHEVVDLANSTGLENLTDALDNAAQRVRLPSEQLDRAALTRILKRLDATLVEYFVGTRDMFAIVLNVGDPIVVRLGDRREISDAAAALHSLLRDPDTSRSEVRRSAARLAKWVLWPIVERVRGKRIVLVPDDALHTVPFSVLPWSAESTDQLVLHHAEISILPSALFLTRIQGSIPSRGNAPRIELIGDPVFTVRDWRHECIESASQHNAMARASRAAQDWTESLPRLPGTRTEVQMIARLARQSEAGSRIETLLGCAAVPSALRRAASEHIDLLHIATHARVDAQRPRLSALALTPEDDDDSAAGGFGLLDILGLKLNSRLVVLSACETSRGRLLSGEGVLGPAQAFLQAGASAVLASYWRVDDQAASEFMQQFYRYLLLDHLPAASALRRAQLDRAATSAFDWAAFALYGWPASSL